MRSASRAPRRGLPNPPTCPRRQRAYTTRVQDGCASARMPRVPPPDSHNEENEVPGPELPSNAEAYWRANLRIMMCLLAVWAFVSYGLGIVFSEALDAYHIGGFPLGFWFGQQGAIYVFVVLIFVYALWMDRLDRRYDPPAESESSS